jgi:hypothetical protein
MNAGIDMAIVMNRTMNRKTGLGAIEIDWFAKDSAERVSCTTNARMIASIFQPKNITSEAIVINFETSDSIARSCNAFGGLKTSSNAMWVTKTIPIKAPPIIPAINVRSGSSNYAPAISVIIGVGSTSEACFLWIDVSSKCQAVPISFDGGTVNIDGPAPQSITSRAPSDIS